MRGCACAGRDQPERTKWFDRVDHVAGASAAGEGGAWESFRRGRSQYDLRFGPSKRGCALRDLNGPVGSNGGDVKAGRLSGRDGAFQAGLCEGQGAAATHARAIALGRSGIFHIMGLIGVDWRLGRAERCVQPTHNSRKPRGKQSSHDKQGCICVLSAINESIESGG